MKRIIITGFIFMFILSANAQYFGFQGGGMATNIKWRNDIYTINTLVKPAFMAGITLDIPIRNTMAVNLALNYKWVGAAMIDSTDIGAVQLGYVNLDVTFNYIFETNAAVRPYIEGGGYGAYLVNAQKIFKPENQDGYTESVKIGSSSTDEIIAWDLGLTIGGGIYLKSWKFGLGYSESIIDLSPDSEWILRNKMGYLKATYFFGKNKSK